ncbi:hypothetical protein [Kribbella sp. DT2]|uniref:hypothetical protein n=1 Tax=Kribbella sp. DT2 TaxID=3393427 RepID=UPI003CF6D31D
MPDLLLPHFAPHVEVLPGLAPARVEALPGLTPPHGEPLPRPTPFHIEGSLGGARTFLEEDDHVEY